MNRSELIERVSEKTGVSKKECAVVIQAVTETISDELQNGGDVRLSGFGTFEVKHRAAKKGRNPRTWEAIEVAAKDVPVFRPGKLLKESVGSK